MVEAKIKEFKSRYAIFEEDLLKPVLRMLDLTMETHTKIQHNKSDIKKLKDDISNAFSSLDKIDREYRELKKQIDKNLEDLAFDKEIHIKKMAELEERRLNVETKEFELQEKETELKNKEQDINNKLKKVNTEHLVLEQQQNALRNRQQQLSDKEDKLNFKAEELHNLLRSLPSNN